MKRALAIPAFLLLATGSAWAQHSGFYTDRPGYTTGEPIEVHAAVTGTGGTGAFRLVRVGASLDEVARTNPVTISAQATLPGSFVEVEGLSCSGATALTLEGWVRPTVVGGDLVAVAGHLGLAEGSFAVAITQDGHPAAYLSSTSPFDPGRLLVAPEQPALDTWVHLAASWDGATLILYVDGVEAARRAQSGPVADVSAPFRLGARAEAPGDLTGVLDGRLDSWALWPRALSAAEITVRVMRGMSEPDPVPPASSVLLYLGFEERSGPPIDRSSAPRTVRVLHHGTPSVQGMSDGRALRLQRDQLVDAAWPVTATLTIPEGVASGLYALQVLAAPGFDTSDHYEDIAVVVRPRAPTPGTHIAVIVPVNTWLAYEAFPGSRDARPSTPGLTPRPRLVGDAQLYAGGNNSAYGAMGDGVSPSNFQGWRRPNRSARPFAVDSEGFGIRAPVSRFVVEWLDAQGLAYDVYTDWDLHAGRLPTAAYRVLVFHGHQEYWSQEMLDATSAFMEAGGSVVALAGNLITWRVTLDESEALMEVRKWPGQATLGAYDDEHSMDGQRGGSWLALDLCEGPSRSTLFGTQIDYVTTTCSPDWACFGRWSALDVEHWLWGDAGPVEGERFGRSPIEGVFTVGHEADSLLPGLPIVGLAPGTTAVALAEGRDFPQPEMIRVRNRTFPLTCAGIESGAEQLSQRASADAVAGNIVYYEHRGGGRVLTVGSTASPWSLGADPHLTALVRRALDCFAEDRGCGASDATAPDSGCGCQAPTAGAPATFWSLVLLGLLVATRLGKARSSASRGP